MATTDEARGKLIETVRGALKALFGNRIRVIIARDRDVECICSDVEVAIWASPDKGEDNRITWLTKGRRYWFIVVGWKVNGQGQLMLAVLWKGKIGWINPVYFDAKEPEKEPEGEEPETN